MWKPKIYFTEILQNLIVTAQNNSTYQCIINPMLMQPTPMHYELCLLHMAHAYTCDRQSNHATFTGAATS